MVYPTSPVSTPSTALAVDKVPSTINFVDSGQIQRTNSLNITDALQQSVPAVNISEVSGNPFQPNLEFRGFVASPVSGTPQGLAVYQNGVRINEAFGDTINWDLIPTSAIKSIAVVTNNPAFGLNALGGAVTVQMKDGFGYHGAEIDTMAGSYGRLQSSAQWGKQVDQFAIYGALEGLHDNGFRNFSPSDIRRFYSDVGYRSENAEFHLNLGLADNKLGAPATTPIELLQQYWGATYTTPQTSANQVAYANLTGKVEVTPTWTVETITHVRAFSQRTVDGNPTGTQPCGADADVAVLRRRQHAGQWPERHAAVQSVRAGCDPGRNRSHHDALDHRRIFGCRRPTPTSFSGTAIASSSAPASMSSVTQFNASAELGTIGSNYVVSGSGIFLGQSGNPVSIGPVSLRATNQYTGLYVLDTFDVTKAFSITAGGRFNDARIALEDQIGTQLNGNATYDRFNPIIGGTYKINSELTAYAGYSEANRAPTPLELGCADPARPCIIAAFLVSDPPLKQVVSRTDRGRLSRHA